jgi:phosphatidylglycerophosphatase A
MRLTAKVVATLFGIGYAPLAPGTAASAAAVLLHMALARQWPPALRLALVAAVAAVGVWASGRAAAAFGQKDPRIVVIDEVAGQLAALAFCPAGWTPALAAFGLFRAFDILKPFPIRRVERLPGGWGIVADDLAAGALSALLLGLYFALT